MWRKGIWEPNPAAMAGNQCMEAEGGDDGPDRTVRQGSASSREAQLDEASNLTGERLYICKEVHEK